MGTGGVVEMKPYSIRVNTLDRARTHGFFVMPGYVVYKGDRAITFAPTIAHAMSKIAAVIGNK